MEPNQTGIRKKENTINKNVIEWLNSLPRCFAYKQKAGPANPGALDVSGCLQGIRIEIEGKAGDNQPTKLQNEYIRRWTEAGAITGCYWSLEEAQKIVRKGAKKYGIKI